ncbi:Dimethyl sulfoxide/trimethylamine N-oxide reductase precursor [Variovorax sp. PBL-H6]|uniref:molybdopterin-dependent oxidoreductase n=1 Tax=Variovorax sp. PBL-H6 TaxID=434009 RepID=UPI001315ED89|nr:molybdopterin-dependent oxidoreductase [Variovorax sp. PBL-H6]VTU35374.1 Dimethyl sulfoxide/trimethylamine N-oxide reductase precursor [Variovorax sp. PBL-H6]
MNMPRGHRTIQTASHWGVYNVEVDPRGQIVRTTPFRYDPHPPSYMASLPETVRSPLRIDQPHVRAGYLQREKTRKRGGEPFIPIGWDEALDLVAGELARVKSEFGNEAIYGGSYGWASAGRLHHSPSVLKRFLGLHGGYVDKRGNHSFGAALQIAPYILGRSDITEMVVPWPDLVACAELVVMFGGASLKNTQIDAGGAVAHENPDWFRRAAAAGIRFVNISPSRQDLPAEVKAEWIPLRPNTDVALMLGIAHTLEKEGLCDRAFLATYSEGYERFEAYLMGREDGQPKDARWASRITEVPAEVIEGLARTMARSRTLVTTSWSIQRADHGEQPVWMTITLAAMLGQIGLPGRGFSLGFGAVNGTTRSHHEGIPRPTLPLGSNPVKTYVPVGRVGDMLLRPGATIEYDGKTITYPETRLLYSIGGNPFHHNGNLNRFLEAWQRLDTVIVHEPWWNPAAKHADIVLPATTTMERNDILAQEYTPFWIAMKQVIEPVGQARNDFDIMASLATRLGFGHAYTEGRDELGWLKHMYEGARTQARALGFEPPEFQAFWDAGVFEFPPPPDAKVLLEDFRRDPAGHRLSTPSGRIEIFSSTIAGYRYADCPPHPTWLEPAEWLGSRTASRFPLHLLSNQPAARLHSQHDHAPASRRRKVAGREALAMHPVDATTRGLAQGDIVRVFNDRGAFLGGLVVADDLRPGVVQISTGAWYDPAEGGEPGTLEKHGNPNVVTLDGGTSQLAQSTVVQTALVQVEKCGSPPPVTAFEPPQFAARSF